VHQAALDQGRGASPILVIKNRAKGESACTCSWFH